MLTKFSNDVADLIPNWFIFIQQFFIFGHKGHVLAFYRFIEKSFHLWKGDGQWVFFASFISYEVFCIRFFFISIRWIWKITEPSLLYQTQEKVFFNRIKKFFFLFYWVFVSARFDLASKNIFFCNGWALLTF